MNLWRDLFEGLVVIAVGGTLWSSVRRMRAGKITVFRCPACAKPTSRAYLQSPNCAASLAEVR